MTSSVAGLMTPSVRPSSAATHLPSMYMRLSVAVAVAMTGSSVSRAWCAEANQGQCRVPAGGVKNHSSRRNQPGDGAFQPGGAHFLAFRHGRPFPPDQFDVDLAPVRDQQ